MEASKRFQMKHNVTFRVLDRATGKLIQEHTGHNAATNTMLEGVAQYLIGAGVLRQGYSMLSKYIPKYISLGTMGLRNQDEDENFLPTGLSGSSYTGDDDVEKCKSFMKERPGYGSDGYTKTYNNGRPYFGLGPPFTSFSISKSYYKGDITYYKGVAYEATSDMIVDPDEGVYNMWNTKQWKVAADSKQPTCHELISPTSPRVEISFRDAVPEYESELPKTIDVIYSAMISTGTLAEFRDSDKDYVFITEAGLWSEQDYIDDSIGSNGLVAGYRVAPPSPSNWYMDSEDVPEDVARAYCKEQGIDDPTPEQIEEAKVLSAEQNRQLLKENVLRVERDQVVQVIWKIQIGNLDDIGEITMSWIDIDVEQKLQELYRLITNESVYASDVVIDSSKWSDSGRTGEFPYAASITMEGIDNSFFSMVQFSDEDVALYDFAPNSTTGENKVTIYCRTKPTSAITLPIVMCSKSRKIAAS